MSFVEIRCVCKSFKLNAELESFNLNLKVYNIYKYCTILASK